MTRDPDDLLAEDMRESLRVRDVLGGLLLVVAAAGLGLLAGWALWGLS